MTLRARLALALGLLAAVAAAIVAIAGYRATADRLYAQVDSALATQATRLADPDGRYANQVCQQISGAPVDGQAPDRGQLGGPDRHRHPVPRQHGTAFASTESTALPVWDGGSRLAAAR